MDGLPLLPPLNSNMHITEALPAQRQWPRGRARGLLLLVFVLHALLGAALGLSVDEAHYALYAAHPALSYFDHPPLVGWLQWPLVALSAPTAVLRLLPGLLWLATMLLVHRLALRLCTPAAAGLQSGSWRAPEAGERAGIWALLVLLLAPLMHILGIGLLPDTLLMLWSAALMLQTLRLMPPGQSDAHAGAPGTAELGLGPWLLLGLLLGLAGLSKYTAIFTALAVALCLLWAHGPRLLRQPGLWLATLLALILVSPVAIWNAQNQWISFAYQAKHGAGSNWQGIHLARFLVVQMLAFGPLLLWGVAGVRDVAARQRVVLGFFAIPFAVLAALAGGGSSLPHWTAPAWVALAPFAGIALARRWDSGRRALVKALVLLQALACLALPAAMVSAGMPFMQGRTASAEASDAPNPFADLHGWDAAGERAKTLAAEQQLDAVAVQNWTLASRIGWYARPLKVYVLEDRFDQFDLWAGKLAVGGSALLVDWSQLPYETPLGAHGFAQCTWLDGQEVRRLGYSVSRFDFYACSGWTAKPQPRLRAAPSPAAPAAAVATTPASAP
jgi:4-amino-4-deoxy-L-arabinose transferase-like glycosyltransferase